MCESGGREWEMRGRKERCRRRMVREGRERGRRVRDGREKDSEKE